MGTEADKRGDETIDITEDTVALESGLISADVIKVSSCFFQIEINLTAVEVIPSALKQLYVRQVLAHYIYYVTV